MALKTGIPQFVTNQNGMGGGDWVIFEVGVFMAVGAISNSREGYPFPPVFGVAGDTLVDLELFPNCGKTRFEKAGDWVSVVRAFVTLKAGLAGYIFGPESNSGFA